MPSRNIVKQYAENQYYHIYSRGVAKQPVFLDDSDYIFFLGLFKRYLSPEQTKSPSRTLYPWYREQLDLLAYCIMPNHIHLLVFVRDKDALPRFMRSLMTSYSMYFNSKYKRVGPVFQSRYLASMIEQQSYLEHITRYIHLNPRDWERYPYSSLPYYAGKQSAEWVQPEEILALFRNSMEYITFLRDYKSHKQFLDEVKIELAHE